jgi:hypothetical protein
MDRAQVDDLVSRMYRIADRLVIEDLSEYSRSIRVAEYKEQLNRLRLAQDEVCVDAIVGNRLRKQS